MLRPSRTAASRPLDPVHPPSLVVPPHAYFFEAAHSHATSDEKVSNCWSNTFGKMVGLLAAGATAVFRGAFVAILGQDEEGVSADSLVVTNITV